MNSANMFLGVIRSYRNTGSLSLLAFHVIVLVISFRFFFLSLKSIFLFTIPIPSLIITSYLYCFSFSCLFLHRIANVPIALHVFRPSWHQVVRWIKHFFTYNYSTPYLIIIFRRLRHRNLVSLCFNRYHSVSLSIFYSEKRKLLVFEIRDGKRERTSKPFKMNYYSSSEEVFRLVIADKSVCCFTALSSTWDNYLKCLKQWYYFIW